MKEKIKQMQLAFPDYITEKGITKGIYKVYRRESRIASSFPCKDSKLPLRTRAIVDSEVKTLECVTSQEENNNSQREIGALPNDINLKKEFVDYKMELEKEFVDHKMELEKKFDDYKMKLEKEFIDYKMKLEKKFTARVEVKRPSIYDLDVSIFTDLPFNYKERQMYSQGKR
ncbi:hypothetical protein Fsol_00384 [Candidatus Fokinia solitaria]|uniref:Uncharacterized protein n=1 Tax=Candidatus Fokinia solitaria TaxID=1802984 RepID=A0A2U8BS65_9RICK|nr:hypothetical protein [Candidatus Fokinia solitaria]AWD33181.1 hypothetical protein Fsol_00384 [Candidatus Fokinia solitaria]